MFFERYESGELAVLVNIHFGGRALALEEDEQEFVELVASAGARPVHSISGSRAKPEPKTFIGSGKLEELATAVKQYEAELVIFNHELSPSQERNLERELKCRVLGRTGLILDIFAQRARTHEGKLQV
ncbi:MAG: GTPase HflX, partial [Pseudomonadales bacterium]